MAGRQTHKQTCHYHNAKRDLVVATSQGDIVSQAAQGQRYGIWGDAVVLGGGWWEDCLGVGRRIGGVKRHWAG